MPLATGTLQSSRWAPATARKTSGLRTTVSSPNFAALGPRQTSAEDRHQAQLIPYQKFLRCLRRLKWKASILLHCHQRALCQQTDNIINGVNFPIIGETGKANAAEIMFKADFFEFYIALERVLVHLLECFGMVITADHTSNTVPPPLSAIDLNSGVPPETQRAETSIVGDSIAFYGYAHRFHANVLAALDRPSNPLHALLGTGKVRQYLGIAKEFRNRWKEVENESMSGDHVADLPKTYRQILADLRLDEMLETILSALELSRLLASSRLASANPSLEVDMINADDEELLDSIDVEDAMDWD